MNQKDNKLQEIRNQIDKLDQDIQNLISQRAQCARDIAKVKQELGNSEGFYRPEREADVLRVVQQRNTGPLSNEEIARLFREIMSACLALEESLNIAFLGPEGTFTRRQH